MTTPYARCVLWLSLDSLDGRSMNDRSWIEWGRRGGRIHTHIIYFITAFIRRLFCCCCFGANHWKSFWSNQRQRIHLCTARAFITNLVCVVLTESMSHGYTIFLKAEAFVPTRVEWNVRYSPETRSSNMCSIDRYSVYIQYTVLTPLSFGKIIVCLPCMRYLRKDIVPTYLRPTQPTARILYMHFEWLDYPHSSLCNKLCSQYHQCNAPNRTHIC